MGQSAWMLRPANRRSLRAFALSGGASLLIMLTAASSALADPVQATCANLGSTLSAATNDETIQLTGLCTGSNASFTLPAVSNLTIEGASSGTNGFDGTGVSTPALASPVAGVDGLTLTGLTFENYSESPAVSVTATSTATTPFSFAGDVFSNDTGGGDPGGGGLSLIIHESSCAFNGDAVTISGSTFSHDSTSGTFVNSPFGGGGGGAFVDIQCQAGSSQSVQITNNTFSHDTADAPAAPGAAGGGLFLNGAGLNNGGIPTIPITVSQSDNRFTGDAVTSSIGSPSGFVSFQGGGEFTVGADITSVGDGFTQDSIPGPDTSSAVSWGAGLSTLGGGACTNPTTTNSKFSDLVATGNTIAAPSGTATSGGQGAAIYAGCNPQVGGTYNLTLTNDTISGNAAAGTNAVGGVFGESNDTLTLQNTILYGDTGSEIAGFGGGITVSYSDTCTGSSPYTGTGNICAAPKLVDVATGDVHETAGSPTLDRGSNSDASGLSTDYYGQARVQYSSNTSPLNVDIGAAEFHLATPTVSDCTRLQNVLNTAASGDVITLAALCTPANSGSASGSFNLPSISGLTIQGASSGTNGFDGQGSGGATASALSGSTNGLVLRNLVIEHYALHNGYAAVVLYPSSGALPRLDHDRFTGNTETVSGGGLALGAGLDVQDNSISASCPYTSPLQITNSQFTGNTVDASALNALGFGGAASVLFVCSAGHTAALTLSQDTFTNNSLTVAGSTGLGGGLYVDNGNASQLTAVQSHDVFKDNSIAAGTPQPGAQYGGGGEWLGSVNLTSTDDEYIGNSLPGPSGGSASSEGGGLGLVRGSCGLPPLATTVSATASNLVAVHNTIGAPSSGGTVEGAGVYAGCEATHGTGGLHLTLINSTVTANSGPGGAAGVDGESADQLTLRNTIVRGDTGAGSTELGGFGLGGGGGSISASFSDVCAAGSSATPFAGTGNICKNPVLASPVTGNVAETNASPTIDAGSNALVPATLRTDFFGHARIVATRGCHPVVDIGAAESQSHDVFCGNPIGTAKVTAEKPIVKGVTVTIRCVGVSAQSCRGTITLTTTETTRGSKVIAVSASHRSHRVVTVGSGSYRLAGARMQAFQVKLNQLGRSLLKRFHKLPVTVRVVQTLAGSRKRVVSTRTVTIS